MTIPLAASTASTLAPAAPQRPVPAEFRRTAEEFEAMALGQLLQPIFAAMSTDGLGGGGVGEEMFRPMLVDEYAKNLARSGGVGLGHYVIQELMRMQGGDASVGAPAAAPTATAATAATEDAHGAHR